MMPRINLKFLAIGQLLVGAMLIALPIFIGPHLIVITDEFPEMSSVLESLKTTPVESNNSQRAAEIIEIQRNSLKTRVRLVPTYLGHLKFVVYSCCFLASLSLWKIVAR